MLNAPLVAARLGYGELSGLDLLELFAFLYPAHFMVPTVKGLMGALNLERLPFRGGTTASDFTLPDAARLRENHLS